MIQQIRKIGNSSGIIIPKAMLDSCDISDSVEMTIVKDMIILKPVSKVTREDWDSLFREANKKFTQKEKDLFEGINNDFDIHEW